jgi:guanylate kinase
MSSVEFIAHCLDSAKAESVLIDAGATLAPAEPIETAQSDPVRQSSAEPLEVGLIGQFRTTAVRVEESGRAYKAYPDAVAPMQSRTYNGDGWAVSLRTISDYKFLHVRVPYAVSTDAHRALETAEQVRKELDVGYLDIVPWREDQLRNIILTAKSWRTRLGDLAGRLILIDGPSGAGKSTLARALRDDNVPGYEYVPRCTSRPWRPDDAVSDEYLYLPIEEFRDLAEKGSFLDYREFQFQMGYGVRWTDVGEKLDTDGSRAVFALVNLGNSRHIQRFVPDATTVLVTAPLDQLEGRMRARGSKAHKPEAIAERLENARRGQEAAMMSDHIIDNRDGGLQDSLLAIRKIVYG